jgi:hypothetical protein
LRTVQFFRKSIAKGHARSSFASFPHT